MEVFFILSGMFFYKSAAAARLMQPPSAYRSVQFIINRFLRLWPIMIFCSILLLPSPMVPNRAAAAWTLLFASNHLPWNKQFMSWLWSDFDVPCSPAHLKFSAGPSASTCSIFCARSSPCSYVRLPRLELLRCSRF